MGQATRASIDLSCCLRASRMAGVDCNASATTPSQQVHEQVLVSIHENPVNRALLTILPTLDAPRCMLTAGALFQSIWNQRAGLNALNPRPDLFKAKAASYRERWPWLALVE